jgi:protein transport protein SEC20
MKANRDVTEALQRTVGLMQKELERSVLSTQLLGKFPTPLNTIHIIQWNTESSTATLQSASTAQDTLNLVIGTSKQLITVLEKTDWLDRMLIISALVFFGLVVLFILKSRIIDRGLRIAFFWTRLLPSSSARAGGEVLVTASASGAAASATLASLIAGQHGGAAELIKPNMDAYESPSFTMLAIEPQTTEQHTGSDDTHVELWYFWWLLTHLP